MKRLTTALVFGIGLWLAGGLQLTLAPRIGLGGANPDFLLVALAIGTLYLGRAKASLLGFVCGAIHGGLAGANLTHYAISRTLGGYGVAWAQNTRLEPNLAVAFGSGFFLTIVSQLILMFLAPPRDLAPFLGATIGSAAYNGVLVLPVYFVMRRLVGPPRP